MSNSFYVFLNSSNLRSIGHMAFWNFSLKNKICRQDYKVALVSAAVSTCIENTSSCTIQLKHLGVDSLSISLNPDACHSDASFVENINTSLNVESVLDFFRFNVYSH